MYSVAYKPKALEEYEQSIEWYAERSIKAAENFILDVQESIKEIKANPLLENMDLVRLGTKSITKPH